MSKRRVEAVMVVALVLGGLWVALRPVRDRVNHSDQNFQAKGVDDDGHTVALRGASGRRENPSARPPSSDTDGGPDEEPDPEALLQFWRDNDDGTDWVFNVPDQKFNSLGGLWGKKLVVMSESGGRLRVALPPHFERPHVRLLGAGDEAHPHITAYVIGRPTAGVLRDGTTRVNYFTVGLEAQDWAGGVEQPVMVLSDGDEEVRGRVFVSSPIASSSPFNVKRSTFGIELGISRIKGLSRVTITLAYDGRVLKPLREGFSLRGVINTKGSRGEHKEYQGPGLPLGAEEELSDFVMELRVVFEGIDLQANPSVAHVQIVDGDGTSHHTEVRVEHVP